MQKMYENTATKDRGENGRTLVVRFLHYTWNGVICDGRL